jgi:hypothetical protein
MYILSSGKISAVWYSGTLNSKISVFSRFVTALWWRLFQKGTWWRLFQKRTWRKLFQEFIRTKLNIFVFIWPSLIKLSFHICQQHLSTRCVSEKLVQHLFKEKKRRCNYLALSTDKSYFGRNQSDSNKQFSVTENVFVNRKSDYYRYQLCPSSRRLVPSFVWRRLHAGT